VTEAEQELEAFALQWDKQYPSISASWGKHWVNLIAFFDYPDEIRKVIYTTSAIESLNSVIRKATERRKLFPTDQSAMKVVYLAIEQAAKKWSMPIRDWKPAESVYDSLRGSISRDFLTAVYTEIFTLSLLIGLTSYFQFYNEEAASNFRLQNTGSGVPDSHGRRCKDCR
jgi:hypothetical protein